MDIQKYINKITENEKSHFWIFLTVLTILSLFLVQRYIFPDYITPGHDANFQYNRFCILTESLSNGYFPNYLDFNNLNGYGYATKLFYPDFTLIPFAFIAQYTGPFYAYQIMLFVMTLLCGIFSYKSVKEITKNKLTGYISAILYTFSLYRIQDMFERAAIAEVLTFTFLPLIAWGLYEIIKGNYKKWYVFSIGYSLFALTHVLSTVLVTSLIIISTVIFAKSLVKEPKRILYLIISLISITFLASYFVFPIIEQFSNDTFNVNLLENTGFKRISLQQIVSGTFMLAPLRLSYYNFVPLLGITLILPVFFRFFIFEKNKNIRYIDILLIICSLVILISSDLLPVQLYYSAFFSKIQFLSRYFEFISFGLAIVSGYYISCILKSNLKSAFLLSTFILLIIMMITIHSTSFRYAVTDLQVLNKNMFDREKITGNTDNNYNLGYGNFLEYLPVPTTVSLIETRGSTIQTQDNNTSINHIKKELGKLSFNINISEKENIELPLTYYKGYTASIDGKPIQIIKSKNGFIQLPISQSGKVAVQFTGTFLQKYSISITLISSILLCIYIIIQNRRPRKC